VLFFIALELRFANVFFIKNEIIMKQLAQIIFITAILFSCEKSETSNTKDDNQLQAKLDSVLTENENLKELLDNCENGADKLMIIAENLYNDKNYLASKKELEKLIEKHPGSQLINKSKELISSIDSIIAEQNRIEQERRAKIEAEQKAEKERIKKEKQAKLDKALQNLIKEYDEMSERTWYRHRYSPQYINKRSTLYAYIIVPDNGKPYLSARITYVADDWLFCKSYTFNVDGTNHTIYAYDVERDNGYGGIWEWHDIGQYSPDMDKVLEIAKGTNIKIRYSGKNYYDDIIMQARDVTALKEIITAYEAMKVN
jgi:hypothetical protein